MSLNTTKYKFIYCLILIGVISCKQKQKKVNEQETVSVKHDINIIDRGRSIYSYNCAPCHNYQGHNTEYHPALNEYISMDRDTLLRKL